MKTVPEITHNPDGSVTLTVGGWVGPDPERIEAAAKAHEAFHNLHCDDPNCMYWVTHVKFATEVLAAAYPVGPVLTLTAEEWQAFVDGIKAQAQREVADALIRMGPTRRTYNRGVSDWIHERIADGGFDENPNLRGITIPESVCLTCADQWFECPDCGGTRHRARGGFDD